VLVGSAASKIDPKAAEDEQRLTKRFETSRLRSDVATIGEILAGEEDLRPWGNTFPQ
jgi:hypothetical protein